MGIGCDQQPGPGARISNRRRRFQPIPFDGEQSLSEDAVAFAALGLLGTHAQARGLQHNLAVGVGDIEIRLDRGGV